MKKKKKLSKMKKLRKFLEEERYNITQLTEKIFRDSREEYKAQTRSMLSILRQQGFPYYSQGSNGIVKIPSNLEERKLTHYRDFRRKRGGASKHMMLASWIILEDPRLAREIRPQL